MRLLSLLGRVWLLAAVVVIGALALGRSRGTLTVAYEGVCGNAGRGVCLQDLGTGRTYLHSHILGASWTHDMALATVSSQGRVLVQSPRGQTRRQLTSSELYYAAPQWAPDGRHVLFEAAYRNRGISGYGLWIADVHGDDLQQLAQIPVPSFTLRLYWSPDQTQLVYFGAPHEFGFVDMWLCDMTALACEKMPLAAHQSASWSPDGSAFVYTPGGNRLQTHHSADGAPAEAIRVFQAYYDSLLAATTQATIYYNMIEYPTFTAAGLLFAHGHERRLYKLGDDRVPVLVSDEKFDTPELYPLPKRDEILLLDQYHTFSTDRIEFMTLDPATDTIVDYGAAEAWRFIGVVTW